MASGSHACLTTGVNFNQLGDSEFASIWVLQAPCGLICWYWFGVSQHGLLFGFKYCGHYHLLRPPAI